MEKNANMARKILTMDIKFWVNHYEEQKKKIFGVIIS